MATPWFPESRPRAAARSARSARGAAVGPRWRPAAPRAGPGRPPGRARAPPRPAGVRNRPPARPPPGGAAAGAAACAPRAPPVEPRATRSRSRSREAPPGGRRAGRDERQRRLHALISTAQLFDVRVLFRIALAQLGKPNAQRGELLLRRGRAGRTDLGVGLDRLAQALRARARRRERRRDEARLGKSLLVRRRDVDIVARRLRSRGRGRPSASAFCFSTSRASSSRASSCAASWPARLASLSPSASCRASALGTRAAMAGIPVHVLDHERARGHRAHAEVGGQPLDRRVERRTGHGRPVGRRLARHPLQQLALGRTLPATVCVRRAATSISRFCRCASCALSHSARSSAAAREPGGSKRALARRRHSDTARLAQASPAGDAAAPSRKYESPVAWSEVLVAATRGAGPDRA